ncbi:MAG: rhomboid family intramembrane serine protease [Acetatifactor sp.]|nr:rhomboid family intramembrane serine protease [Acetatifactor sp.]
MRRWRQQPIVSGALVITNVIIFILCMFTGNRLYALGELDRINVLEYGEYGRIIWSMFLHADTNHLFSNMIILFFLGSMIEKEIGHIRYAVLYFLSGIGGGMLSLLFKVMTSSMVASVGASGAVFGLDGVLLAMVLLWNERLPNVTPVRVVLMIVLSLYSGFSGGNVDNAAHVGGLLVGFLGGCIVCIFQRRKHKRVY